MVLKCFNLVHITGGHFNPQPERQKLDRRNFDCGFVYVQIDSIRRIYFNSSVKRLIKGKIA